MAQATFTRVSDSKPRLRVHWLLLIRYLLLVSLSLLWLAPVIWMLLTSIKPESQITIAPPRWLPNPLSSASLQNYTELLFRLAGGFSLPRAFVNSLIVASL